MSPKPNFGGKKAAPFTRKSAGKSKAAHAGAKASRTRAMRAKKPK